MNILSGIFDVLLYPFKGMHPIVGLLVISAITGVVMLIIFGRTTNQAALKRVKSAIVASIIEIWLFKDRPGLMFAASLRVMRHDLSYLRYSLVAVVFIIVPVVLIMVQLGIRYSHRPLHPSEEAIVSVKLNSANPAAGDDLILVVPQGLELTTPPLRMEDEVDWRVRAVEPGDYELIVRGEGFELSKNLVAGSSPMTLAPVRAKALSWDFFLYPAENPIPSDSPVNSIELTYSPSSLGGSWIFPVWLWIFFLASIAAGFALKGLFRVEV